MGMFDNINVASEGSKDYLRLKDGDQFKLRFVGDVVVFTDGFGNTRWGSAVWNHTLECAQAYGFTKTIVNAIQGLEADEDWGDVREYDVKVSRTGSTKEDTEYSLIANPNRKELTEEQLEACAKLDLSKMFKGSISVAEFNNGARPEAQTPVDGEPHGIDKAKAVYQEIKERVQTKDTVVEDISDDPIDLSEIPFN